MKTLIFVYLLLFCVCNFHLNLRYDYMHDDYTGETWDWRDHNPISSVDNELTTNCSSSYIFAALGAIEGVKTLNDDYLKKISSQEYIDCSGRNSCAFSSITDVFDYYSDKEVCSDYNYVYNGLRNECQNYKCSGNIKLKKIGYKKIKGETGIKTSHIVPVPTKIYIDSLKDYKGGIYKDYNACNHEPNHWVLVVGFGKEEDVKYWTIKNDYGEEWGEKGYLRLERGKGICGIGTESYALYYSKWKTWFIVVAVVAVLFVISCCICCCCCCCAAATGSTAKMTHCCCCCCYGGKESCVHPERINVRHSNKYNHNDQLYDLNRVDIEVVQPVQQQQYIQQPSPTNNYTPAFKYDKVNCSNIKNEPILLPGSNTHPK